MRPCFTFTAKSSTKPAVLAIDDEIGFWGTQAKDFRAALDAVEGDQLVVEINSPGGDVFAGFSIFNMLRSAAAAGKTVTTRVTGIAASVASAIFLAGDKREMPSNAMVMVHGVSSGAWGTLDEMADHVAAMAKIQSSFRQLYIDRMGVTEARADELMSKDNWFTAQEAKDEGLATALLDAVSISAKFNVDRAALPDHVAQLFVAKHTEDEQPKAPELSEDDKTTLGTPLAEAVLTLAASAGLADHGTFIALSARDLADAQARVGTAREIVALCKIAGLDTQAKSFIRTNASIAEVRAKLLELRAADDEHIDTAPPPAPENKTTGNRAEPSVVNASALWASHNNQTMKGR